MNHGKWYFVFAYRVTCRDGNGLAGPLRYVEIALRATIEAEAISEAKAMWDDKVIKANARWEMQKKMWTKPPKTAFEENGPYDPCVIYKIVIR